MTTHPHLEGLIPVAVEAFLASTGQAHTVTQLQRDLTTTCMRAALQAALAALPGGGVDVESLIDVLRQYQAWNPLNCERDADLYERAEAALSPTPPPHEADRNERND